MDVRFLTFLEFHNVHFYRLITLAILLPVCGLSLLNLIETARTDALVVSLGVLLMMWRFSVEWLRVKRCQPAFLHEGELVVSNTEGHRRVPLSKISSIKSRHSIFMVRRYRSWSEHLAFIEFTLNDGERLYTLAESAVFESPPAKRTVTAVDAAILSAKMKDIAKHEQEGTRRSA